MSIRIDVQMDHGSESTRYVATATEDGKHLHEVEKNGARKSATRCSGRWQRGY